MADSVAYLSGSWLSASWRHRGWLVAQASGARPTGSITELLFSNPLIPVIITMVFLYVFLLGPDRKKRKETERLLASLKKNDHVVTVGGIYGTVIAATPNSKFITLRVDDSTGTKLKVLRSAVSHIGAPEEADGDKAAE